MSERDGELSANERPNVKIGINVESVTKIGKKRGNNVLLKLPA